MANLYQASSGAWRIRFRFSGRQYYRSLDTSDGKRALRIKGQVEETLELLKRGRIALPEGATADEAGMFIMSGGRIAKEPTASTKGRSLKKVTGLYFEALPEGAKADSSLCTEKTHTGHLLRLLRGESQLRHIGVPELQDYVKRRSRESGLRGNGVQPETIRKELATFRLIWNFAKARGWVDQELSLRDVMLPKAAEKQPFLTWDGIKRKIKRGGLTDKEVTELWGCLFLREREVVELLEHVQKRAAYPYVYPMFGLAALTGARRSEILRSEVEDFNFDRKYVLIREKKRRKTASQSYRQVQLSARLEKIMRDWFSRHPGGRYTICDAKRRPITTNAANYRFGKTLERSKWSVLKGFHVLRHSFASVCAMHGIPDSILNAWMGHVTDEMRDRYRHLFPEQTEKAMQNLFDIALFG